MKYFFQMTGSIADGLWTASMDSRLQESRGVMRAERGSSSSDHLLAGIKGLGMGVIGGLTSMVTQPIEGASRKGVQVDIPSSFGHSDCGYTTFFAGSWLSIIFAGEYSLTLGDL